MPWKNAEKKKEYAKRYREAHRKELAEKAKVYNDSRKEEHARYYLLHRDERRSRKNEQQRRRYSENIEAERARGKRYRDSHKAETARKNVNYSMRCAEHKREHGKWYRKTHPEQGRIDARNRRARVAKASGAGWSVLEERQLVGDYLARCAYCGKKTKLTMDHVVPIARGGAHSIENIVPACLSCNSSKRDKPLLLWMYQKNVVAQV